MNWIISLSIFLLLILSYVDLRKSLNTKAWIKIILGYMICSLYLDVFGLLIPIGAIVGFIYISRTKDNYLLRSIFFGLVCIIITFYMPKVNVNQVREISRIAEYSSQFNQVNSVYNYQSNSEINSLLNNKALEIKNKNNKSKIDIDPNVLFRIWVLSHKGFPIEDLDWLYYKSPFEIHYYWQSNHPDNFSSIEYVVFQGVGYMGMFKRDNTESPYRLYTIIEFDKFKVLNPMIP
jgi:hypothetical protein